MEKIDFDPLKETINNIALQLVIWMAICTVAYVAVFILLRIIKMPAKVAHFVSGIAFLFAMYYSFINGFIPGIQGAQ